VRSFVDFRCGGDNYWIIAIRHVKIGSEINRLSVCVCVCVCVCVFLCVCTTIYIYIYIYVCVCVCVCVYLKLNGPTYINMTFWHVIG